MFWLYLLGVVTTLTIALRRVIRRLGPLSEQLYWTKVDFDHMQSGVAWVRADGTLRTVNSSLATTLGTDPKNLINRDWLRIFPEQERERARDSYRRMLLLGMNEFAAHGERTDGTLAWLNVLLIAVHDHKMRFVGHHCLVLDSTRTRLLEDRLNALGQSSVITA
jgi:PAS domain S-box-containing protein